MSQLGTEDDRPTIDFLWLEITGKCQLRCLHCYAESSPEGTQGIMTRSDWLRVLEQAKDLGVARVQFIGGEPTQHPDLVLLARYALQLGLQVEVYSNLVGVTEEQWKLFGTPGVQLATSYYTSDVTRHAEITGAANSHRLTKENIVKAVSRSIPLRVGLIDVQEGQSVDVARAELEAMGVTHISFDRLRQVGRGVRTLQANPDQLCGQCASGVMAVSATGEVWPCVFSRWLPIGNVREQSLRAIVAGSAMADVRTLLGVGHVQPLSGCTPRDNGPTDPRPQEPGSPRPGPVPMPAPRPKIEA